MYIYQKGSMKEIQEITISPLKANVMALVIVMPFLVVFYLPFLFIYGKEKILQGFLKLDLVFLVYFLIAIILHELIHGITWSLHCKHGFKSIKFGIIWKFVTPYAHCKEVLKVNHYIFGTAMPGIILGILPVILGYILQDSFILFFGLIFILAAGGDFYMIWLLRNIKKEFWIADHPNKIGCIVIERSEEIGKR